MLVKVKAFTQSKKEEVVEKKPDEFEVRVKAKTERGLANKAIIAALAVYFDVPAANVRMVKGFAQKSKIFDIRGI